MQVPSLHSGRGQPGVASPALCQSLSARAEFWPGYPKNRMTHILQEQLDQMRDDWDRRARDNALHHIATGHRDWETAEFFASGQQTVENEILTDTGNIFQGKDPRSMRILEIGCGVGRVTRALAELFGDVYAVDVSGEMIERARINLHNCPNVHLYQNNGCDLSCLPDVQFDFAYSTIVFQHVPTRAIIENYVKEAARVLRPGALFKFQVQGGIVSVNDDVVGDTWVGVSFSDSQAADMAERQGFEPRYRHGANTQYFWLWFFRQSATNSR